MTKNTFFDRYKITKRRLIIFITLFYLILVFSLCYYQKIENFINTKFTAKDKNINGDFVCYYLDVNQGDCSVIKLPDNKIMVIDCANITNGSKRKLIKSFDSIFTDTNTIDYLVVTHPDIDHCGNAEYILNNYNVITFFRPPVYIEELTQDRPTDFLFYRKYISKNSNEFYYKIINTAYEKCENIIASNSNIKIETENYCISFWNPIPEFTPSTDNELSSVIFITCNNKTFLFTGDIDENIEEELIKLYPKCSIDFLKVAHHGSKTSTSLNFLNHFKPTTAIISCGKDNNYDFPSSKVMANLDYINCKNIYQTDILGNIIVSLKGDNLNIYFGDDYIRHKFSIVYFEIIALILLFNICFVNITKNDNKVKKSTINNTQ